MRERMLEGQDIVALWQAGGDMRQVAAAELVRHFDAHAPLFFQFIQTSDKTLRRLAKRHFPFLRDGMQAPQPFDAHASYAQFAHLHEALRRFFSALDTYLDEHPGEKETLLKALASQFNALQGDLVRRYPETSLPTRESPVPNRQLMVFVTGRCNLHCPYCFSSDIEQKEISEEQLRQVFRWAKEQGVTSLTPCGGEPLMYRHFQLFLDQARELGLVTYFATNFTVPISRFKGFTPDLVKTLYIHLTDESLHKEHLRAQIVRNVAEAQRVGIELVARANITPPTSPDIPLWLGFMQEMGLKRLHVALTMPSEQQTNTYVHVEQFQTYVPIVEELLAQARERGIEVAIAKPIPLCLFSKETASSLLRAEDSVALCGLHRDDYMYNVCLSPSLIFTPCLGLNEPHVAFRPSLKWDELSVLFRSRIEGLLVEPTYERCRSCFLWERRLCQGVCLSYKEKTCFEN